MYHIWEITEIAYPEIEFEIKKLFFLTSNHLIIFIMQYIQFQTNF